MGITILKLDRDWKLLNADVISVYPVDLKSIELIQKHVNKAAKNYSRTKRHYLVKITSLMIYNDINLSQKKLYERKMIQNGSEINAQKKL